MGDSKKLGFIENFMLAGVAAGVSKTAAAPIERVKLLVQNQDEMIKQGRLDKPYKGVIDCTQRVLKTEGVYPFWRGKLYLLFFFSNFKIIIFQETWPMSLGTSLHRLLTLPSRMPSRQFLLVQKTPAMAGNLPPTLLAVVLLVLCLFCLCTLLTMPEPGNLQLLNHIF